jgi:hypothetical protein
MNFHVNVQYSGSQSALYRPLGTVGLLKGR